MQNTDESVEVVSDRVKIAKDALQPFLDLNPLASIGEIERPKGVKLLAILTPWGDKSLVLTIPKDEREFESFQSVVNNLFLPPRYSAIWHRDTKDFEILWTAFKLSRNASEIPGRKFSFKFVEDEYKCEFAKSSEALLKLAGAFRPISQSDTDYRNLGSFDVFVTKEPEELLPSIGEPHSFWIRNLDWN